MNRFFVRLLGVNWATTLSAIGLLSVLLGKLLLAYRKKDILQILNSGQELTVDLGMLFGALGLLRAKDGNTVGVGDQAKTISLDGTQTHADGRVTDSAGHAAK